jgi:hypothetical protein
VIDTVGYNERMWISNLEGMPHSEKLHTIERFTRTDVNNMRYELVIDDPGAYTRTWTTAFNMRFTSGVESFEFICQDGNQAFDLMVGSMESRSLQPVRSLNPNGTAAGAAKRQSPPRGCLGHHIDHGGDWNAGAG